MVSEAPSSTAGAHRSSPLSSFSWSFAGNVTAAACQWFTLAMLTKLGSREMLGQYALGQSIATPILFFANLALSNVMASDAREQFAFREYLGLRLVTTSTAVLPMVGLAVYGPFPHVTSQVFLILGLSKALDAITDMALGLFQQRQRLELAARTSAMDGLISLVLMTLALALTRSIVWASLARLCTSLIVLLLSAIPGSFALLRADAKARGDGVTASALMRPSFDLLQVRRLVVLAAPLGTINLLLSLNAAFPRWFVDRYQGEAAVGFYFAIAALTAPGSMVTTALSQMAIPRLAVYYAAGNRPAFMRLFAQLCLVVAALGILGVLGAAVLGRPVLMLAYRPEYGEQAGLLVWLMVATAVSFISGVFGSAAMAMRLFRPQLPIHCANSLVAGVLFMLLVKSHGLLGAAWAALAGATFLAFAYGALMSFGLRRIGQGSLRSGAEG